MLLGTDVLSQLGFALTEAKENHSTNLLCIGSVERNYSGDPDPSERAQENGETTPRQTGNVNSTTAGAVVKLIRAICLPAGHSKLVRAAVDSAVVQGETCLFEPRLQALGRKGLAIADALVGVGDGGEVALVISNPSTVPVMLEEGDFVGELHHGYSRGPKQPL